MGRKANLASNTITTKPRRENDFYPTPKKAVEPVLRHLLEYGNFCEPCAGDGALIRHLEDLTDGGMWCSKAYDIDPQAKVATFNVPIEQRNALNLGPQDVLLCDLIITNPPYQWDMLKPLLEHLPSLKPTWLLLPFSYACNKRMAPYMKVCKKLVPIGRVKWIEDSKQSSTDDFGWYLFDSDYIGTTKLYPRNE